METFFRNFCRACERRDSIPGSLFRAVTIAYTLNGPERIAFLRGAFCAAGITFPETVYKDVFSAPDLNAFYSVQTEEDSHIETSYLRIDSLHADGSFDTTWLYTKAQAERLIGPSSIPENALLISTHTEHRYSANLSRIKAPDIAGVFVPQTGDVFLSSSSNESDQPLLRALLDKGDEYHYQELEALLSSGAELREEIIPATQGRCDVCLKKRTLTRLFHIAGQTLRTGSYCAKDLLAAHQILHSDTFPLDLVQKAFFNKLS